MFMNINKTSGENPTTVKEPDTERNDHREIPNVDYGDNDISELGINT